MGTDKLLIKVDGQSLLERTLASCAACFSEVKLVAPEPAGGGKLSDLGYPVVTDSPVASGPMAGVIAALEDCATETCFVTAADLFDLSAEVIALIVSGYSDQQYFGIKEPGGIQPLCGIYHKSALTVLKSRAAQREFGMIDALKELNTDTVTLPPGQWRNLNCPADLVGVGGGHA